MVTSDLIEKLESIAQEVATQVGCELYLLEWGGSGGRRTLQVFIDRTPGGAGIEDCTKVSRGLSEALDQNDPIPGAYDLEVSTPGLDRPLRKPWHFQRVIGKKISFRISRSLEAYGVQNPKSKALKQLSPVLAAADEQNIEFEIENETVKIPFSDLEKAKLLFELEPKGQKKGDKKKK